MTWQRFTVTVTARPDGTLLVPVPFDPDTTWGAKPRHHVTGTVNGIGHRGALERAGGRVALVLGRTAPARRGLAVGDPVTVEIAPEGPQRSDLAPDVAEALAANPDAGAFFDGLAQFYRRGYLRWIDGTTRRPELRAQRIAEMVRLLEAGHKARP